MPARRRSYGDLRLVERHWVAMERYMAYLQRHNPDLLWTARRGNDYGDWLAVGGRETPHDVLATAYWAYDAKLMIEMARALARADRAEHYLTWNLAAGTNGIFLPYILSTVGSQSQAASVALQSASFVLTAVFTVLVFMRFTDRGYVPRRIVWAAGAVMQITAFALFLVLPFTTPVAMANIALFGIGAALAGEAFYKVWSQELFPTLLRGTAQGITFGTARVVLGVWSFFVPVLAETGIKPVAALLTAFLLISGVIGFFFMPHTAGRSLEDIEEERAPDPVPG